MSTDNALLKEVSQQEYKHGFVTDIEADAIAPGLSEDVVRLISQKKDEPEWLLDWRLKAYRLRPIICRQLQRAYLFLLELSPERKTHDTCGYRGLLQLQIYRLCRSLPC